MSEVYEYHIGDSSIVEWHHPFGETWIWWPVAFEGLELPEYLPQTRPDLLQWCEELGKPYRRALKRCLTL